MEARKTSGYEQQHTVASPEKQPQTATTGTHTVDSHSPETTTSGISTEPSKTPKESISSKSTEIIYDSITYIGRFQPIHIGHCQLIKIAFNQTNNLIIVIGSTNQARSKKNPYNYQEREKMILLAIAEFLKDFPDKQCKIIGQDDYGSNEQWFFEINQQVEKQQRQLKLDPKSSLG